MTPQQFTPHHQRLRTYLLETVKLPAKKFRFGDSNGIAEGKVDVITPYSFSEYANNPTGTVEPVPKVFTPLKPDTQLRFTNGFDIHLIIKEFDGELSLFIAQILYWLASENQDVEFEYKVYWNNESSINLECFLEIEERAKGSQVSGFNVY